MRGETKVWRQHLERTGADLHSAVHDGASARAHESTSRQCALAEEAIRLGWAAGAIQMIDADLGLSGCSVEGRDRFKEVVARVCLGEAPSSAFLAHRLYHQRRSRRAKRARTDRRRDHPMRHPKADVLRNWRAMPSMGDNKLILISTCATSTCASIALVE
jgi:hypothetical protein